LFFSMIAAFAAAAVAGPIDLTCTVPYGPTTTEWAITLDQQAGTATWHIAATDTSVTRPASFLPDKVIFNGLWVSRTDLSFHRGTEVGQCRIAEVANRKF
jgi:hypothetical protein